MTCKWEIRDFQARKNALLSKAWQNVIYIAPADDKWSKFGTWVGLEAYRYLAIHYELSFPSFPVSYAYTWLFIVSYMFSRNEHHKPRTDSIFGHDDMMNAFSKRIFAFLASVKDVNGYFSLISQTCFTGLVIPLSLLVGLRPRWCLQCLYKWHNWRLEQKCEGVQWV